MEQVSLYVTAPCKARLTEPFRAEPVRLKKRLDEEQHRVARTGITVMPWLSPISVTSLACLHWISQENRVKRIGDGTGCSLSGTRVVGSLQA